MRVKSPVVLVCAIVSAAAAADPPLFRTGMLYQDLGEVAPEREVKSVPAAPGAPSFRSMPHVDLSDEVPPIRSQGNQGSCVGWAVSYYHRSQLEYRERHWDLTDPNHQFSPAFTYNQVNGGADYGSNGADHMDLICDQGCASMADSPYDPSDCTSWPSESAYSHALPFRCRGWAWFRTRDTNGVNAAKQILNNGSTLVLGIWCWDNIINIDSFNNIYCVADRYGSNRGGHGVCIVGYDDTLTTNDGPGAFRLTNSWGKGWGDEGFWWMSYAAVMDSFLSQRAVLFMYDTVGYEPSLLGRVRIDHSTRDRVGIAFSVGPRAAPLWSKEFRDFRRTVRAEQPFPDHNLVFDLTEAAPYIAGRQTDSVYFAAWDTLPDSLSGTIRYFSAQYLPWVNDYPSTDTPVTIPDDGTLVCAGTRIHRFDHDVGPTCVLCPSGFVRRESTYTPKVRVRNFGLSTASFPVRLTISPGYSDSASVLGLAPGDSSEVEFREWVAPESGEFTVRCSTGLADDEYPVNDTLSGNATVRLHDVAVTAILSPADTVDSGAIVRPGVRVRNNGTQPETFIGTFSIPDEGYKRMAQVSLEAKAETVMTFVTWVPRQPGYHALSCTLALGGDEVAGNDRLSDGVFVRRLTGVAEDAATLLAPGSIRTVNRSCLFVPAAPDGGRRAAMWLLDAAGRRVMPLEPGPNDVSHFVPGVYFIRSARETTTQAHESAVVKIVLTD